MNDINEIHLTIPFTKEENSLNHSLVEDNKDNTSFDENKLNELLTNIKESLSKKYYKSIYKQLEIISRNKGIYTISNSWKIFLLKMKTILKIVDKKITKYLVNQKNKEEQKNHISSIKKYLEQLKIEIFEFSKNYDIKQFINNEKIIDKILHIYFYYIYIISLYNLKIGNVINSITYLALGLRLYKETKLIKKSFSTENKIEKCFILLIQIFLANEDYVSSLEYLRKAIKFCLYNLIYQLDDPTDGIATDSPIFFGKKEPTTQIIQNKNNKIYEHILNRNEKCIMFHVIFLFLYKGLCYESLGKLYLSIKSYYQCLWFSRTFFNKDFKEFQEFLRLIEEKNYRFKNTIEYLIGLLHRRDELELKLKYSKDIVSPSKSRNIFSNRNFFKLKFNEVLNKINKLKINEINVLNEYTAKRNIKYPNSVYKEGKDKGIFLSELRLLNLYLRDDFKNIIENMEKIKRYDLDDTNRKKKQKMIRTIYYQDSLKNKKKKREKKKDISPKIGKNFLQGFNLLKKHKLKSYALKKPFFDKKEKGLNKYFNKKYIEKREYIKKLESRETKFQKYVLDLKRRKNSEAIRYFNKAKIREEAYHKFNDIMTVLESVPIDWREELSQKDLKEMKEYEKMENIVINSLSNNALVKFKLYKLKTLRKSNSSDKVFISHSSENIKNNNKSLLNNLDKQLDSIKEKEIYENMIYRKLLSENRQKKNIFI